ncbi:MAG TPA: hypothetical protein VM658_15500 [bacterium]|nr:hypothetical protein [bacterium]
MPRCFFCSQDVAVTGRVMRKDVCPSCRRDLHCCKQCRFHDPAYHNQCREPKAEMARERDKANLCDYFEFAGQRSGPGAGGDTARKKLEDLFGK